MSTPLPPRMTWWLSDDGREGVAAAAADERVDADRADDRVVARLAVDPVVADRAGGVGRDGVVTAAAEDRVVAAARGDHVARVGALDRVAERRADDPDAAVVAGDGVAAVGGDRHGPAGAEVHDHRRRRGEVGDTVELDHGAVRGRARVVAEVDDVVAGATGDRVAPLHDPAVDVDPEQVALAVQAVVALTADDGVGALPAADHVVARQPADRVVAAAGRDHVALRGAGDRVALVVADDGGLQAATGDGRGLRGRRERERGGEHGRRDEHGDE